MKPIRPILTAIIILGFPSVYGQWEKPVKLTHQQASDAPVQVITAGPLTVFEQDSVKGSAGKDVSFIDAVSKCGSGLRGVAITNKSIKLVLATVELTTAYNGHISKKIITVDDLTPNEIKYIGCYGCTDNTLFKTCTTYKILTAVYK